MNGRSLTLCGCSGLLLGAGVATTFGARCADLTAGCNACHDQEQVPFLAVHPPEIRFSTLGYGEAR
jgi:hypothetical protein